MEIRFPGNDFITAAAGSGLTKFMPEPASKLSAVFQSIYNAGLDIAKNVVAGTGTSLVGIEPQYAELIQQQLYAQDQMQRVSLISNIEKSKHESEMSVVRNVRVG
jgi:hypothetical protein